jgi:hypothetical protein
MKRVPLIIALCLALAAVPLATASAKPVHHTKTAIKHRKAAKKKHSTKAAHPATGAKAGTTATDPPCAPTAATPGAVDAATSAFLAHVYTAHLETSPTDQVKAILSNPSNYVLVHTALVQAMAQTGLTDATSIGAVLDGVTTPFFAHIYSAHLSQSPQQQLAALLGDPNAYVQLHTAWVQTMLTPLTDWFATLLGGSPTVPCPSGGGSGGGTGTGSGGGTPPPPPPAPTAVMIMNMAFTPATVTVAAGSKVTWTNMDSVPHTVTSSGSGPLNSPLIQPNGSWSYTFTTPGTYHYYCSVHPNMTATVTVT